MKKKKTTDFPFSAPTTNYSPPPPLHTPTNEIFNPHDLFAHSKKPEFKMH